MARKYYVLMVREEDGQWAIHFGDYDRSVVKQEQQDVTKHEYLKKNTKIVETGDRQEDIERAQRQMNAMPNKW